MVAGSGLAEKFIRKELDKIHLHEIVTPELRNYIKNNLKNIIFWEIKCQLNNFIISTSEEENLIFTEKYQSFFNKLFYKKNKYKFLVIIGYSFFRRGDEILDKITFNGINEYLIFNPQCKIVIIDTNPDFHAHIFSKYVSSSRITCKKIDWGVFTYLIYKVCTHKNLQKLDKFDIKTLNELYFSRIKQEEQRQDVIYNIPHYIIS